MKIKIDQNRIQNGHVKLALKIERENESRSTTDGSDIFGSSLIRARRTTWRFHRLLCKNSEIRFSIVGHANSIDVSPKLALLVNEKNWTENNAATLLQMASYCSTQMPLFIRDRTARWHFICHNTVFIPHAKSQESLIRCCIFPNFNKMKIDPEVSAA